MAKKIIKNKFRFPCYKCSDKFTSWQVRDRHMRLKHQPPIVTKKEFIRTGETHNLKMGIGLNIGDKVLFTKEGIISKITKTEGSDVVNVEVSVIKDSWNQI